MWPMSGNAFIAQHATGAVQALASNSRQTFASQPWPFVPANNSKTVTPSSISSPQPLAQLLPPSDRGLAVPRGPSSACGVQLAAYHNIDKADKGQVAANLVAHKASVLPAAVSSGEPVSPSLYVKGLPRGEHKQLSTLPIFAQSLPKRLLKFQVDLLSLELFVVEILAGS
jgi:hypothetical protein